MTLNSPGVEIDIIDQSQYIAGALGPIPLIIAPSIQNKTNAAGTGVATGTLVSNAGKMQLVTSQRDLTTLFGVPNFINSSGSVLQGSELNEYGLLAAYGFLGVADAAYIMRPNVDLAALHPATAPPTGTVPVGTYWLDLTSTTWGLLEWNQTTQAYTVVQPTLIADGTMLDDGTGATYANFPKASVGKSGDYALVFVDHAGVAVTTIKAYYRGSRSDRYPGSSGVQNPWVLLGSENWVSANPTVKTLSFPVGFTTTSINMESTSVASTTFSTGTTAAEFVTAFNNTGFNSPTGVDGNPTATAFAVGNSVYIYSQENIKVNTSIPELGFIFPTGGNSVTYNAPKLAQQPHTQVPQWKAGTATAEPTGSVWFKTTSPNNGASIVVKRYNSSGQWAQVNVPLFSTNVNPLDINDAATDGLSADGVHAATIPSNSLYMRYGMYSALADANFEFGVSVELWGSQGTSGQSPARIPLTAASDSTVTVQIASGSMFNVYFNGNTYTVTSVGTVTNVLTGLEALAAGFNSAGIPDMKMTVNTATNTVVISNLDGHDFALIETDDTNLPLKNLNIPGYSSEIQGNVPSLVTQLFSNWNDLMYTASVSALTTTPANGTLWYNSSLTDADIMVNELVTGVPTWRGYRNVFSGTDPAGPTISATAPTTQSTGAPLVYNDLWIDTSDLENYPMINRWTQTGTWEVIDNMDHTTEDGIVFADARSRAGKLVTDSSIIADMLLSDYVDPDVGINTPPEMYPSGTLLFNLRRSSYNVKEYRVNYFNTTDFPNILTASVGQPNAGTDLLPYNNGGILPYANSWVSVAPVDASTGEPNMGRKSQRAVIVQAMTDAVNSSLDARKDQFTFNIIAAPGYPELATPMIELNTDRTQTAFILIDPPLRLQPTSTALVNWATNAAGAASTGEQGLTVADDYSAVYYPHAITTELKGNSVLVPASHMMLTQLALNDQVAYPWFAPAGLNRGVVTNASSVGYLNTTTGTYSIALLGRSESDSMYLHRMNPIVIQPTSGGIVVSGQKTLESTDNPTALNRINVARLVIYIRTNLAQLVKHYLFEPNDSITRSNALSEVNTFFNELVAQRALYDFLAVCDTSNNTPDRIDNNELWIDVAIKPVKAVEFIYIPVRIFNTGATLTQATATGAA